MSSANKFICFCFIMAGVVFLWKKRPHAIFPRAAFEKLEMINSTNPNERNLASFDSNNPCAGKEKCVLLYLAPWCRYSQMLRDQLPTIRSRFSMYPKVGFMIIVGDGSDQEQMRQFATTIAGTTFIDSNNNFKKLLKPEKYPDYFVIDKYNKLLARENDAISLTNELLNE